MARPAAAFADGYGSAVMVRPRYDGELGAFTIDGHPAGPAGALVVAFRDGSVVSLDRIDPTCPLDALLCGEPDHLGPDAGALVEHLFGGAWPDHVELPDVPAWTGEALVRARALGRVGLALARGAGRDSLWWAEAVQALGSWALELGWSPPDDVVQDWSQRAAGPLAVLLQVVPEALLAASAGLGPLLALVDAVSGPLGAATPPELTDFRRSHGGEAVDESELGAALAELGSPSLPPVELAFRGAPYPDTGEHRRAPFRGGSRSWDGVDTPILMGAGPAASPSIELDVPAGLVTSATTERLDEARLLVSAQLTAEIPGLRLYVAAADDRGSRLDHQPAFVSGRLARAVLLVAAGGTPRVRWSLNQNASIGPVGDLARRDLVRAAARLADETRLTAAAQGSTASLAPEWDEIAAAWEGLGEPGLSAQARSVTPAHSEGAGAPPGRAFVAFVEALAPALVAGLSLADPEMVDEPGHLVQLAYDAGDGTLAADLAIRGAAELRRRGQIEEAAATLKVGIAACCDQDQPPVEDRARLYEALAELGG